MLYFKLRGIITSVTGFQTYYPGVRSAVLLRACRQPVESFKALVNSFTQPLIPLSEIEPEIQVIYETNHTSPNPAFDFWMDSLLRN